MVRKTSVSAVAATGLVLALVLTLVASGSPGTAAERNPRADRIWKGAGETMTLVCFAGPNGELLAEAVVIAEK